MVEAKFYIKNLNEKNEVWCLIEDSQTILADILVTGSPELFNLNFINEMAAKSISDKSMFENEIFIYFYIKYIARIDYLFRLYTIEKVYLDGKDELFLYISSYCVKEKIKLEVNSSEILSWINLIFRLIKSLFISILGALYFCLLPIIKWQKISKNKLYSDKEFALIHSKSWHTKINNVLSANVIYYYDSIKLSLPNDGNHFTFYSVFDWVDIITNFIKLPFESVSLFYKTFLASKNLLGYKGAILAISHFSKRIPHFILIQKSYLKIFQSSCSKRYYSGDKEQRYGLFAMKLGAKTSKEGICIPHGLAYSYRFPLGVFGNKYYCITQLESEYLNSIYNSNKFIFDHGIVSKMFSVNGNIKEKAIVYFTEPRRIEVNVEILSVLNKLYPLILIKLHPLDNKNNYLQFKNIKYVEDFVEAISYNICIARKSTILIEALYNNSIPISVLFDAEDRFDFENTFPSLRMDNIYKVYTPAQLSEKIAELLN